MYSLNQIALGREENARYFAVQKYFVIKYLVIRVQNRNVLRIRIQYRDGRRFFIGNPPARRRARKDSKRKKTRAWEWDAVGESTGRERENSSISAVTATVCRAATAEEWTK